MCDGTSRGNLAASLRRAAMDLSKVQAGLTDLSTDDEIERVAKILDRIAEDAIDGATILRVLAARRERARGPLLETIPHDADNDHEVSSAAGDITS
jgi:hypothetical protein